MGQRFLLDRRPVRAKNTRAATRGTWHTGCQVFDFGPRHYANDLA